MFTLHNMGIFPIVFLKLKLFTSDSGSQILQKNSVQILSSHNSCNISKIRCWNLIGTLELGVKR